MIPVKSIVVVFACCIAVARSGEFSVPNTDVENPACKYVLAELIRFDQKLLDLSSFFPKLQEFESKYVNTGGASTRSLGALAGILQLNDFYKDLLNQAEMFVNLLPPCAMWGRSYLRFWVHDVVGPILKEQLKAYFDL